MLDAPAETLREALWDLVWAGEVTNDAWAPLRAPRLSLARNERSAASQGPIGGGSPRSRARRFGSRRLGAHTQVQGRWSLAEALFRDEPSGARAPAHAGRTAAGALRHRHPRAGAGRGHPRWLCAAVRHVRPARDARALSPRLFHRGDGRRPVRAARRCGAAARGRRSAHARCAARGPWGGWRQSHASSGRRRPRPALRRGAAVAQARGPGAPPLQGGRRIRGQRGRAAGDLRGAGRSRPGHAGRGRAAVGRRIGRIGRCGACRAGSASWRWSGSTASRRSRPVTSKN